MELASRAVASRPAGDRILKVNHAGEHGAVNIYRGQLWASFWRNAEFKSEIASFAAHERRHRAIFAAELERRHRRRCRSYHLCGLGGLVLGIVTGLCGRSSIAATTVAVESVVLGHLERQMADLRGSDPDAVAAIQSIIDDERHHHDSALDKLRAGQFWPRVWRPVVSVSTEAVIWLGMHL